MDTPRDLNTAKKTYFSDDDPRQELIKFANSLGGKDFVLTLDAENGEWTTDRRSMQIGVNGHWDWGICQLNYQWHAPFIDHEEFNDPYKQIEYCWGVYQDGMKRGIIHRTFYGYNNRHKVENKFINL